jgi:transcriptional regulator GlxA family with amidase domain
MESASGPRHPIERASRRQAVERVEAYVRAHRDARVPVSRLSLLVGLSERALRTAFHDMRGMSPNRWMRAERLECVRRVLCNPPDEGVTVTDAATASGFYELGRFAAVYREAFGEPPSDTLRGALRSRKDRSRTREGETDAPVI